MKYSQIVLGIFSAVLTACGGGGDSAPSSSTAASYTFVAPATGTTLVFAETIGDNLNNSLNRNVVETISAVHADGSFTTATRDPSNNTVHLGAKNYTYYPTVNDYDNTGHTRQIVTSYPNGTSGTCVFSDPASSPANNWNFTYTETCGTGNPVAHTQSGSYLGTETITVPAGTFNTDKFQVADSWTNAAGTTITETIIQWRNSGTPDSVAVKRVTQV